MNDSGETTTERGRIYLALGAIILLAACLRLYGLARFSIWYDESTSLYGMSLVDRHLTFLRPDEMRVVPFFSVLLRFWHSFVSNVPGITIGSAASDFLLRLLPLTSSLLSVPLIFVVARYLTGSAKAGLIAALLMAISPFHIYYAQEIRPHALYSLVVLAAQYYTFRAIEEDRRRLWVAAVALSSLSFYTYYFSVFSFAAINVYVFLMYAAYRDRLKRWVISQICLGLTLIPAVLLAFFTFKYFAQAEEQWFPHPNLKTVAITVKNYFAGYSPQAAVYWPLFLLAVLALVAGVFALRSKPRNAVFLVLMSFLPLIMQVVFWGLQDFAFYTFRAQIAFSSTVFILAAAGLAALRPRWLSAGAVGLLLLLTVPLLADHYAQRIHPVWSHRAGARYKVDSRGTSQYIAKNFREGDFVAHSSTFTLGPFKYHYLDTNQSRVGFTKEEWQGTLKSFPHEGIWRNLGFYPERIDEITAGAKRVWYVQSWWEPEDLPPLARELRAWCDRNGVRIESRVFDGVTLLLFDMEPTFRAEVDTSWVADFGSVEVPYHDFSRADPDPPRLSAWRDSFNALFPPDPSPEPLALDVWYQPEPEHWGLGPPVPGDAASAAIHLANRSEAPRSLRIQAFGAEAVVPTIAFRREPGSDVWRPVHSHYGKVAMRARLSIEVPSDQLSGEVALAEGRYGVFVQMYQDAGPSNERRGVLRVNRLGGHGERYALGEVHGHVEDGEEGWHWLYLGELESHGSPVGLELIADNTAQLPKAQVDIDRLMFVRRPDQTGEKLEPYYAEAINVAPGQEKTVEVDVAAGDARPRVIEIECFEAERGVYRALTLHLLP